MISDKTLVGEIIWLLVFSAWCCEIANNLLFLQHVLTTVISAAYKSTSMGGMWV